MAPNNPVGFNSGANRDVFVFAGRKPPPSDTPGTKLQLKGAACTTQRCDCPFTCQKGPCVASARWRDGEEIAYLLGERALYRGLD